MEHKIIKRPSGIIHYWISPRKEEYIVFLHGALMDHTLFQHQVEFFKEHFTVLTLDVPAHGRSRPYTSFSLEKAAHELHHILEIENISKVHLVGQSMGGYIGQLFAYHYPEWTQSLTTVGSSPLQLKYYSKWDMRLMSITPFLLRLYPTSYFIKTVAQQIACTAAGGDHAKETLTQYTKEDIVKVMSAVYPAVQHFNIERLNVTMLITYGEKDVTGKVQDYCNRWAKEENRPLKVIEKAAHNANFDNPEQFNQVLYDFLNG
ncbi:MAG: alpha/beta hydrolase [Bacteroidota bacterium]